jgi:hypothetical protein
MKTDTEIPTENKYVQELRSKHLELTAENLLKILRPKVEEIFQHWGENQPPSQELRALRLVPKLTKKVKESSCLNENIFILRHRDVLQYFMAVHRTVWILEGRPI